MVAADFMAAFPAVPRRRRDAHGSRRPSAGDGLGIGRVSPTDEGWAPFCHKLDCGTDRVRVHGCVHAHVMGSYFLLTGEGYPASH